MRMGLAKVLARSKTSSSHQAIRIGVTLTSTERATIYKWLAIRSNRWEDLWRFASAGDVEQANRLCSEIHDELQLVVETLGWGPNREGIDLSGQPDLIRRVFERVRAEVISAHRHLQAEERRGRNPEAKDQRELEYTTLRAICDKVLTALEHRMERLHR